MSDVIEANFLIESDPSSLESIEVFLPILDVGLFFFGIDNFPQSIFLGRGLIFCFLQKDGGLFSFDDSSFFSHIYVVFHFA